MQINRLTTEKQCRQACKGPAASGKVLVLGQEFQLGFPFLKGLFCSLITIFFIFLIAPVVYRHLQVWLLCAVLQF